MNFILASPFCERMVKYDKKKWPRSVIMKLLNKNYVYYALLQARVKVYDLEINLEAQILFFGRVDSS